ncbi:MAG: dihydrofolate reductase family protein [Candidatus Bathyarchaeia archaeon]|jgi:dihydrofolate reductase
MRKLVVAESVTLDGVFEANTMAQWSSPCHSDKQGEYIKQNISTSDALLLGRVTYEFIAPYWLTQKNNEYGIADKMNSMPKYVVSSTLEKADWNNSTIIKGNIIEEITRLKQKPGQNILINGSANLVKSLMPTDLIDEYRFLVHPIIMGSGKRFFKDGMNATKLKLVKTETFPLGVVLVWYESAKN